MKRWMVLLLGWPMLNGVSADVTETPRLPVREITVFKDGHAFVRQQGEVPVSARGEVVLDHLPAPVLGTFWPYSSDPRFRLRSVTAGQRRVTRSVTPLTLREMIEANPGALVRVREVGDPPYQANLMGFQERSAAEREAHAPADSGDLLPQKGDLLLLRVGEGVKAIPLARLQDLTFLGAPSHQLDVAEIATVLTLRLGNRAEDPPPRAEVGFLYLQRGIRWIPHYRITLDGQGQARIELQATLLNELTDLEDVSCNLVIGVPTFFFKETTDPMALQAAVAQLSPFFRDGGGQAFLSNAIMTQTARMGEYRAPREVPPGGDPLPESLQGDGVEDLHVFQVRGITLRKGERMVFPVTEFTVPYEDVYVLSLPLNPPAPVWRNFDRRQRTELAALMSRPTVMHKVRLRNHGEHPFTTAPALVFRDQQLLAQGMMTYTSRGAAVDVAVTTAVDLQVSQQDVEMERTPNVERWRNTPMTRIDLEGSVTLTNHRKEAVRVEVTRHVFGNVTGAEREGVVRRISLMGELDFPVSGLETMAPWWSWWSWPDWWTHFNGISRIDWTPTLEPGEALRLAYTWQYFWN